MSGNSWIRIFIVIDYYSKRAYYRYQLSWVSHFLSSNFAWNTQLICCCNYKSYQQVLWGLESFQDVILMNWMAKEMNRLEEGKQYWWWFKCIKEEAIELVWIRIWGWLKVVNLKSKEKNGRNDKNELKNHMLQIHMIMRKFRMTIWIEWEEKNVVVG